MVAIEQVVEDTASDKEVHPAFRASLVELVVSQEEFDVAKTHPVFIHTPARDESAAKEQKAAGNALFKACDFDSAIDKYVLAIKTMPFESHEHSQFVATCFCNKAACELKICEYEAAEISATRALEKSPDYVKALVRRAVAFEHSKKLDSAAEDWERVSKIPGAHRSKALLEHQRLSELHRVEQEKMKDEMMGRLKDLGNTILGKFGMSLDNFQLKQDDSGGYSVSMKS